MAKDMALRNITTDETRDRSTDDQPGVGLKLTTPVLRFSEVPAGHSQSRPIVVEPTGPTAHEIELEVVAPPLAPFSVVERSPGGGRRACNGAAKIWIRYDANSPMAIDSGRITVAERSSGRQWTIALDGRGSLAF